jgi:multiple antibiotic resistance protein
MHDPNYVKITTGLFIMLNPFVLIPVFLGLTGGMNKSQKMKVAFTTCIAVFIIMMIAVFGGHHVLSFFGITINDFRIAGGLLIFLMAISMARAKEKEDGMRYSDKEHEEAKTKDTNIAVVPLAIPLMAGPAAISVSIIDAELCSTFSSRLILVAIILGLSAVLWVAMALAEEIGRFLGHTGQQVLTRVMGLILLAISIEFLVVGIQGAFHLKAH